MSQTVKKETERKESIHKNIEKFKEMENTVSKDEVKNKQKEQSL